MEQELQNIKEELKLNRELLEKVLSNLAEYKKCTDSYIENQKSKTDMLISYCANLINQNEVQLKYGLFQNSLKNKSDLKIAQIDSNGNLDTIIEKTVELPKPDTTIKEEEPLVEINDDEKPIIISYKDKTNLLIKDNNTNSSILDAAIKIIDENLDCINKTTNNNFSCVRDVFNVHLKLILFNTMEYNQQNYIMYCCLFNKFGDVVQDFNEIYGKDENFIKSHLSTFNFRTKDQLNEKINDTCKTLNGLLNKKITEVSNKGN